jgi:hypothetical protein
MASALAQCSSSCSVGGTVVGGGGGGNSTASSDFLCVAVSAYTVTPDHVFCPLLCDNFHLPTNGVIGLTIICCFYKLRDM